MESEEKYGCEIRTGGLAALARARGSDALPVILFDGHRVWSALTDDAKRRTSPENVSDVLDVIVKELRSEAHPNSRDEGRAGDALSKPLQP